MIAPTIPERCAVAFKEWAGVTAALARGWQSIILRKGGIAEGPSGFAPEHPVFWLYPTHVHEAEQGLRRAAEGPPSWSVDSDRVPLQALAVVESVARVDRAETLKALEPLHVWTAATVIKRFHYRQPGLWVLGVRVYLRAAPEFVPVTPDHAGCKTWVALQQSVPTNELSPVLSAIDAARHRDRLAAALLATC